MIEIYYGHSKITYNTRKEHEERSFLEKTFKVCCPNRDMGERGDIEPYLKKLRSCDGVVCSEYHGHIGKGVFTEITEALKNKKKVFCLRTIDGEFKFSPVTGVELVDETDWKEHYGRIITGSTTVGVENGNKTPDMRSIRW